VDFVARLKWDAATLVAAVVCLVCTIAGAIVLHRIAKAHFPPSDTDPLPLRTVALPVAALAVAELAAVLSWHFVEPIPLPMTGWILDQTLPKSIGPVHNLIRLRQAGYAPAFVMLIVAACYIALPVPSSGDVDSDARLLAMRTSAHSVVLYGGAALLVAYIVELASLYGWAVGYSVANAEINDAAKARSAALALKGIEQAPRLLAPVPEVVNSLVTALSLALGTTYSLRLAARSHRLPCFNERRPSVWLSVPCQVTRRRHFKNAPLGSLRTA
jgi:hypothetical protein